MYHAEILNCEIYAINERSFVFSPFGGGWRGVVVSETFKMKDGQIFGEQRQILLAIHQNPLSPSAISGGHCLSI